MTAGWWPRLTRTVAQPLNRTSLALVANSVVVGVLGILFWALAARMVPQAQVGVASALIAGVTFVSGFAQLNLRPNLVRFTAPAGSRAGQLVGAAYGAVAVTSVIGAAAFIAAMVFTDNPLGEDLATPAVAALFVVATVASGIFALQDGVLIGIGAAHFVPLENAATSLLRIGLLVAGVAAIHSAIFDAYALAMVLAAALVSGLLFGRLLRGRQAPLGVQLPSNRELTRFIAGDYVASLFALAAATLLPIIVLTVVGERANAAFYVVWIVVVTLGVVPRQIGSALVATASVDPATRESALRSAWRHALLFAGAASMGTIVTAPLVTSLYGPRYVVESTLPLVILGAALVPQAVTIMTVALARLTNRVRDILLVEGAIAAIVLPSAVVGGLLAGIVGVASAWFLAHVVVGVASYRWRIRPALRRGSAAASPYHGGSV